jgi:hypothetical protein
MNKTICCSAAILLLFIFPRPSLPAATAAPETIQLVVDTSQTLGPIDLTRYALAQGGLSEQPMISDRVDQIAQLHPQTIRLFLQEYFDIYPAHHQYHCTRMEI